MTAPTELFALWQEADGLAADAERIVSKEMIDCANGGLAPDEFHIEVARAMRQTATERLQAATMAYRFLNEAAG